MYTTETRSPLEMASVDHHVAAAMHHEEAAESHRRAAACFTYEDYQQANEQARLAQDFGKKAERHCTQAMK